MELIAGVSLAQRLRDGGPFSPRAALPIVRAMAAAIGAAHRAGVVHRDFKSENVMLAPAGADDVRVVVMDFGLARNTSLSTQDSLEGRGLAGTLAYMAPEQLDGQRAGHASDIYALGVVIFEMLTGNLPFVPEPGEPGLSAVLTRLSQPAPPVRSLVPDIDARWNDVVARCLEKVVDRRLASADDIARALGDETSVVDAPAPAVAAPAPAAAAPAGGSGAAPRSRGRRAALVAVGLGALVAVGAAVQHRSAPDGASTAAPRPASSPAHAPTRPPAESAAPPPIAARAAPEPPAAAVEPQATATTATAAERRSGDRPAPEAAGDHHPAARRPVPRAARRDQTAAASSPKLGSGAPASAADKEPTKPRPPGRSTDPDDGFIFQ
jgi:serine/threonine-protein kinase